MKFAATTSEMFTVCYTSSDHTAYDISLFLVRFIMCVFSTNFSAKKNWEWEMSPLNKPIQNAFSHCAELKDYIHCQYICYVWYTMAAEDPNCHVSLEMGSTIILSGEGRKYLEERASSWKMTRWTSDNQ